jgi:hypothetical protein
MRTRSGRALGIAAIALGALLCTGVLTSVSAGATVSSRARSEVPAKKRKNKAHTTTTTAAKKTAKLPSDACTLLTTDEIKPLVPGTGPGVAPTTNTQPNEVVCRWEDPSIVQDVVVTVTQLPSSIPTNQLTLGLGAEAQDSGKKVSGVGDYAIVTSAIPADAEAKVLVGHVLLSVEYSSEDPLGNTKQDDVVGLAKLALGRL